MINYDNLKQAYLDIRNRFFEANIGIAVLDGIKSEVERQSIINFALGDNSKEEVEVLFQSYGLKYDEAMLAIWNEKISQDIELIDELVEQIDKVVSLHGDINEDVNDLSRLYDELAMECNNYLRLYNAIYGKQSVVKQYQTGENVIAFFRRSDDARFLVEEDIDKKCNTNSDAVQNRYYCLEKIFTAINSIPSYSFKQKRLNNFVTEITTGDHASDRQYLIKSDYSGIDCNFSRLKTPVQRGGIDNTFRMSFIKITMPQENVDKIGAKSRMVLLIIGAADIKNHNTNSEYSEFISEYETYSKEVQKVIKMFEDPNTPQEELLKLLDDSSDLYNMFVENDKKAKQMN